MYWLNGVPRVYAVNGPKIQLSGDGDGQSTSAKDSEINEDKTDINRDGEEIESRSGEDTWAEEPIVGLCVARNGNLFATMTKSSIAVWQTKPTAAVAAIKRSQISLENYGPNSSLLMRPDSAIIVVQTLNGYLITYSIATDLSSRSYQIRFLQSQPHHRRHHHAVDDSDGIREVSLRFRVAIKVDAGISKALALDNELMVATTKPAAIQLIRWTPDQSGNQTSTELLSRIPWLSKKATILEMVYDRAMNLLLWITGEGEVYAVQYTLDGTQDTRSKIVFNGHKFHSPENDGYRALQVAVNARFSLFAVSCANGEIHVYAARDYMGNIPLSHKLLPSVSAATMGPISFLNYSPDGYCLFAGYQNGWTTWSVFGKPGGSSFLADRSLAEANDETCLAGVSLGAWIGGGSDILLVSHADKRVWALEAARSALTGCFSTSNLARALLQTGSEIILYRGHDLPDLTTISGKDSLWHHAQYPPRYLHSQWPIRTCSASQDGRYVAIAGRRGLAHYSVHSNRWKTFEDAKVENSFAVQGGMCWYGHILIAAVECNASYELRMYSRELALTNSSVLHSESLQSPAVFMGPSGEDSLLVYTYDNILYHYVINSVGTRISLVQVGQIAFHGIVRSPARVRAISWVLPEDQLRDGDPSQDVAVASVLFLVDGKLVLLQPSVSPSGELKYDMRIVAHNVEYYVLMRDQLSFNFAPPNDDVPLSEKSPEIPTNNPTDISLRDSLWVFCGNELLVWNDIQEILRPKEKTREVSKQMTVSTDFYPLSILLNKGIVLGVEPEITQRRDVNFTLLRFAIRTQLFLPYILQHDLAYFNTRSALSICHHFFHLSYFPHALEILLHHVLDDAVDDNNPESDHIHPPAQGKQLLPIVLSFLQSANPPELYLDILVQCIRKTELRSWRTLFAHLPSPDELFEQALRLNCLKTAGGYLLVLQGFDDNADNSSDHSEGHDRIENSAIRILTMASQQGDWDLCGELASFLIALDGSGEILKRAVIKVGLRKEDHSGNQVTNSNSVHGLGVHVAGI
ncbi:hypothetical protein FQN57_005176 [Myotisia sp. PD_48]|nr:hypothetical protein FQN57_005176 [Myotisia sp. PD_48]